MNCEKTIRDLTGSRDIIETHLVCSRTRDNEKAKAERQTCEDRLLTKYIKLLNPDIKELQQIC